MVEVLVCGVVDVRQTQPRAQRTGFSPWQLEQRPQQRAASFDGSHPAQTPKARAAAQMQQDGLGLIRRRVRQRDAMGTPLLSHLMQRGMPSIPGPGRKPRSAAVELQPPYEHRKLQLGRHLADKHGFAPRPRTQAVVDMTDREREPIRLGQERQQTQHRHGVPTARTGHE